VALANRPTKMSVINLDEVNAVVRPLIIKRAAVPAGVVITTVINVMTFEGSTSDPIQKAVRDALIG
jgi:hypothetical protein